MKEKYIQISGKTKTVLGLVTDLSYKKYEKFFKLKASGPVGSLAGSGGTARSS